MTGSVPQRGRSAPATLAEPGRVPGAIPAAHEGGLPPASRPLRRAAPQRVLTGSAARRREGRAHPEEGDVSRATEPGRSTTTAPRATSEEIPGAAKAGSRPRPSGWRTRRPLAARAARGSRRRRARARSRGAGSPRVPEREDAEDADGKGAPEHVYAGPAHRPRGRQQEAEAEKVKPDGGGRQRPPILPGAVASVAAVVVFEDETMPAALPRPAPTLISGGRSRRCCGTRSGRSGRTGRSPGGAGLTTRLLARSRLHWGISLVTPAPSAPSTAR